MRKSWLARSVERPFCKTQGCRFKPQCFFSFLFSLSLFLIIVILNYCKVNYKVFIFRNNILIYSEAIKSLLYVILNTGFWENVGDKMLIWSLLSNIYLCKTQTLTVLQSLIMELRPLIENLYFPSKLALYLANDILHCTKVLCICE